ncbi:MAG: N-acetylglucosamine-6-phosphate deacetylase [Lachnospiraceae bacterium]|jgi:N-acetylglucosamine-6-phosphate deacetylase|nr:N-acetylglucosamine-6-phosphate deacetylase [Lachnospiraceae bacterium]
MTRKHRITHGLAFHKEGLFLPGDIYICNDRIVSEDVYFGLEGEEAVTDAEGGYIIPGLTDIHFHGCMGSDCCDGSIEAFRTIAAYELRQGITSITPATMTMPEDTLAQICRTVNGFSYEDGADLCGLYMEGPFISADKKGAQNGSHIHTADTEMLQRLQDISGNKVRTVVVAPETEGAMEFIRQNSGSINISIAHTTADYETSKKALSLGASQLTHMFNAMPPLSHRAPGPIGAAADDGDCMVELICDGVHVHPSVVRTAFRIFGDGRIILISDSMRAAGMADGTYDLGGQAVTVKGNLAVLKDGTLAGSVTNLMDCLRAAVRSMGIPLASAVKCAAVNPARAVGIIKDYGTLEPGKYANIVILNEALETKAILHKGKTI